MNTVEEIVKNELLEDMVSVFALGKSLPSLDMMFGRYRCEVIMSGPFLKTYRKLIDEGVLMRAEGMLAVKGPNWKEPKFMTEGKYSS